MGKQYRIVRRKDGRPEGDCMIDFYPRNYKVPLVGCSNSTILLPRVGDVIGLIFQSTAPIRRRFTASCPLLPDPELEKFHREGTYYPREEHCFRVSKLLGNTSRMEVEKVFIDGMKVIQKIVKESFTHEETVSVASINQYALLEEFMEEGANMNYCISDIKLERTLESIRERKCKEWTKFSNDAEQSILTMDLVKLQKLLPYKNYKNAFIELENENSKQVLINFLSSVEKHRAHLVNVLGEEAINELGNFTLIEESINSHYATLRSILGDTIQMRIEYGLFIDPQLGVADIMQNLKQVKQSQIYRIYDVDRTYCMLPTATVSDWGGCILPESIRGHLKAGCTVRAYLCSYEKNQHNNYEDRVIYFKLLHPSGKPGRFLAQLLNMYLSEYEDIVVEIDVAAVSEIPLTWEGNEYLLQYIPEEKEDEEKMGYAMTGLGAAPLAKDSNEPEARRCISLYYDIYHLFSY